MKLYAMCLVKDEDDIITQTLSYAARYCEKIFVLDNGSSDSTWELVQSLSSTSSQIVPFGRTLEPYRRSLRSVVYYEVRSKLSEDDWWLILDSDEFLAEDPRPVIAQAVREGADVIRAWQVQFRYTYEDLRAWEEGKDSRNDWIFHRRRYYLIDWQERRLFRNRRDLHWADGNVPAGLKKRCRRKILNRHYRYRDPQQISKRLRSHPSSAGKSQPHWRSKVTDPSKFEFYRDGDPWRFHLSGMMNYYSWRLKMRLRKQFRYAAATLLGNLKSDMDRAC
jgi:glycosyltransferase involved in cell wall biosynthesis